MTRPNQIRRIVAELRHALGNDVPAWELLQLARIVLEAHREPEVADFEAPASRSPFFALEVDTAFERDGGFGVLNFEQRQGMAFGDELPDDHYRTEARLRGLIGRTAWPRTETD
jgi:hypothetical protein